MNEQKQIEIKDLIYTLWDSYEDKSQMAKDIEYGYIFGLYANNEHYSIDEITRLIKEVDLEKNPPAPIVEEPVVLPEELINQA